MQRGLIITDNTVFNEIIHTAAKVLIVTIHKTKTNADCN